MVKNVNLPRPSSVHVPFYNRSRNVSQWTGPISRIKHLRSVKHRATLGKVARQPPRVSSSTVNYKKRPPRNHLTFPYYYYPYARRTKTFSYGYVTYTTVISAYVLFDKEFIDIRRQSFQFDDEYGRRRARATIRSRPNRFWPDRQFENRTNTRT